VADFPEFDIFFRAANAGRNPFPWQRRLAATVAAEGWPTAIGVPTGLGKTACLDIAVWALARAANRGRTAPTRIWYVVNRRLLVDSAYEHANDLAGLLARPDRLQESWAEASQEDVHALEAVARALRELSATSIEDSPLHVVRLRGAAELGSRPPDPAHPALILSTVPMFASRLLFRGYGSSITMRPIDAALAGTDSLVLLDEAHLARPLMRLVEVAAECDLGDPTRLLPGGRARCRLVALTATGEEKNDRFDLDADDFGCDEVRDRLMAAKPVELVATIERDLARVLAEQAVQLLARRPGSTCVVFCNTVGRAREVMKAVDVIRRRAGSDIDLELLTGRMREHEAKEVRRRLLDPEQGAPSARDPNIRRARDLIVVATQTLEVGADLDFDFLVTETAGTRALIQRLGRLNRLGRRAHARAVICHAGDRQHWPPYGTEPERVWTRLQSASEELNLTPKRATEVLGPPKDLPPEVGELLPEHLWEFARTSFSEPGEPPVELFFEGLEPDIDISVCWRAYLPGQGEKLVPSLREEEAIEVPVWELRQALESRDIASVHRLAADRGTLQEVTPDDLRPGDQVVLPVVVGLYDRTGWNPDSTEPVFDVAPVERGMLLLNPGSLDNLVPEAPTEPRHEMAEIVRQLRNPDSEEADPVQEEERVTRLLEILDSLTPHPWLDKEGWRRYLDGLDAKRLVRDDRGLPFYLVAPKHREAHQHLSLRVDALEELSFEANPALLSNHVDAVAHLARHVATRLGFPETVVASLGWAGQFHDLGKHDLRFQRWLDPEASSPEPLAKSGTPRERIERDRRASGWPRGGRHELLSVRLLSHYLESHPLEGCDPELVLHLVAAHHGHGRPWIGLAADTPGRAVVANLNGVRVVVEGNLAEPDWEQPWRFRTLCERYGLWGLALLQAVLSQADHVVSKMGEVA
jgi:CRISPR-associated endonuclease/helicase Cas3